MPVADGSPARRGLTPPGGPSTFDLFSWSEGPDASDMRTPARILPAESKTFAHDGEESFNSGPVGRPTIRMHQPAGGVSTIAFGDHLTPEEAEALMKRRPGSDTKRREMSGNAIFGSEQPIDGLDSANGNSTPERPSVRVHQPAGGVSQICFGEDGSVSPKKPTSLPEVAKQRELSGSQETIADIHVGRQFSTAKVKELVGSDIFGPPSDVPPRSLTRNVELREEVKSPAEPVPRNVRTSVKVSNPAGGRSQISFGQETAEMTARKVHNQKVAELTGNNIFKGDSPSSTSEKPVSVAKLREMSGSDIFADEKPVGRDCVGGIRKPPGGESSLALV
ncbi:hypothetical protein L7F22_061099 [Adiantum nelumboides]|nr:hypothetical protein [Adiantum nelumboides]